MKTANVKFLTLELAALKDYKRELSEKQMPNTAVIIFISLYLIFLPGNSLFWGGGMGGAEESVLPRVGQGGSGIPKYPIKPSNIPKIILKLV